MTEDIRKFLFEEYSKIFVNSEKFRLFFAPGRINVVGEHTDYTGGYCMPAGISAGTFVLVKPNSSAEFNAFSINFPDKILKVDISSNQIKENNWGDYLKGVLVELAADGYKIDRGFDGVVYGNIPNGSGLSSSASLEMSLILAILGINGYNIPENGSKEMIKLTLCAQRAENNFVGVKCGILDQFAIGNAKENRVIKMKCDTLDFKYSPINLKDKTIIIMNTNKKRRLEESKYNERRSECERGFEILKNYGIKKTALGDVTIGEWNELKSKVKSADEIIYRRLNHVVGENDRVLKAFESLQNDDLSLLARLINESGDSLKTDFEVTGDYLDAIVEAARSTSGVIAARMTGAGFGGCAIAIAQKDDLDKIKLEISQKYQKSTGIAPEFYNYDISDGAREIEI
ncbi:MAG TPA: galactokinase [Spirochaetota bacterium]|nr:galactokinase [Spirochaetota bacterium]HOS32204.1 galactokinase [Spirochaetota bacterium]HOS55651.1 galactokinase [Spirochaetota bacterium]HPK60924.1 galactokinase [Spirochaetota bacterium]HQF78175.1 galactokinase [Spirochaetota bacterium]